MTRRPDEVAYKHNIAAVVSARQQVYRDSTYIWTSGLDQRASDRNGACK